MKNLCQTVFACFVLLLSLNVEAQVPVYNSFPTAEATIFLDFDGHKMEGTAWNSFGAIHCEPANLSNDQITEIFNRVAEDYRPFNINITTDSTVFLAAPLTQRMRVVITISSSWYGSAGGVSYIGSFRWADHTPAVVFSALLNFNTKNIAEAASHEAGHTLGLRHQSLYNSNCVKTEYNPGVGSGEIGWAPIMGVGYYRNFTLWNNGTNAQGCSVYQDDLGIITGTENGFGYREDDHDGGIDNATLAPMVNNQFVTQGVIEKITDKDVFKFIIPTVGNLRLNATPYNIGTGNSGSNLDIQLDIMDEDYNVLATYNPQTQLSLAIDSVFTPGLYYISVQGKGNIYAPEYASLGSYSVTSSFRPMAVPLPLHKLELKGVAENNKHKLNWEVEADENIVSQVIEVSSGSNRNFHALATVDNNTRNYTNTNLGEGWLHYRIKVSFDDGNYYYSNVIALRNKSDNERPVVMGNQIAYDLVVNSPSVFEYAVIDYSGRIINKGRLAQGLNHINTNALSQGIYIIRFTNGSEQFVEKFMRR
jgi:hypothetical protein